MCVAVVCCSGVLQWCVAVVCCSGSAAKRVTGTHTGDDTHMCVLQWCVAVVCCSGVVQLCFAVVRLQCVLLAHTLVTIHICVCCSNVLQSCVAVVCSSTLQ